MWFTKPSACFSAAALVALTVVHGARADTGAPPPAQSAAPPAAAAAAQVTRGARLLKETVEDRPPRWIERVSGDIYLFHQGFWNSLFVVTPEGVILVDPLSVDGGQWLKAEIEKRFEQDVKYVIYSHHHADHAAGAEVFQGTLIDIIAQEKLPANVRANADTEWGVVKVMPTRLVSDRDVLEFGGKRIELLHLPTSHASDMLAVYLPYEKILFTVDTVTIRRTGFMWLGSVKPEKVEDIQTTMDALRAIEAIDFTLLVEGHLIHGTKRDVRDNRIYLEDLRRAVQAAIDAGKSRDEVIATVTMDDYRHLYFYDEQMKMNVEAMYAILTRIKGVAATR
jgi:glyoxylase-like metal-dependent hydrolase (beta-lactamase superfamily II)